MTMAMSNSYSMSQILSLSNTGASSSANEFLSTRGNCMQLGSHKRILPNNSREFKNTMTYHHDGPREVDHCPVNFSGSLSQTRFHKGFQRKSESNIMNPLKDAEKSYRLQAESRAVHLNENRKASLTEVASTVNYNVINGEATQRKGRSMSDKPHGLRMVGDGLGEEAPRRGNAVLRESAGRYFAPYPTGVTADYRQEVLLKEGVSKARMTSIIELGKGDLKSAGVEDQFAKSEYTRHPPITGLSEMRRSGAFSPTKQKGNPSGNMKMVKSWGKGVPLKADF